MICNWLLWCFFVWLFVLWQLIVVWCWSLSVSLTFCQLIFVSSWCLFYYCLFIYSLFVWFYVCLKIYFIAWLFSDHGACLFYHDTFVGTPTWRVRQMDMMGILLFVVWISCCCCCLIVIFCCLLVSFFVGTSTRRGREWARWTQCGSWWRSWRGRAWTDPTWSKAKD